MFTCCSTLMTHWSTCFNKSSWVRFFFNANKALSFLFSRIKSLAACFSASITFSSYKKGLKESKKLELQESTFYFLRSNSLISNRWLSSTIHKSQNLDQIDKKKMEEKNTVFEQSEPLSIVYLVSMTF